MKKLPNIVLIIMDTTGAKHCSLHGYQRQTTPMLERIAEEAMVYRNCFAPSSWTPPSHTSLFTGLYPSEHGCDGNMVTVNTNLYVLPEILKSCGYRTCCISSNPLVSRAMGFDRGFDEFYEVWDFYKNQEMLRIKEMIKGTQGKIQKSKKLLRHVLTTGKIRSPIRYLGNKLYTKYIETVFTIFYKQFYNGHKSFKTLMTSRLAKKVLRRFVEGKPLFLFLNFMQTHAKYNPPPRFRNIFVKNNELYEKRDSTVRGLKSHYAIRPLDADFLGYLQALYDQDLLFLDTVIGDLYHHMSNRGLNDNTIFIVTSDHGELFGEHGLILHLFSTYNELIHVPLIIKFPPEYKLRGEERHIVQLHDIFPTILDIVSSPVPKPDSSQSLLSSQKRDYAVSQLIDVRSKINGLLEINPQFQPKSPMNAFMSVISSDMWKFTRRADGFTELYDLNRDFYENNNLFQLSELNDKTKSIKSIFNQLEVLTGYNTSIPSGESVKHIVE